MNGKSKRREGVLLDRQEISTMQVTWLDVKGESRECRAPPKVRVKSYNSQLVQYRVRVITGSKVALIGQTEQGCAIHAHFTQEIPRPLYVT